MKLSKVILPSLQASGNVVTPSYDPSQLSPGILQVGVGNFFRSHFSAYMHDVLEESFDEHQGWGIVGASVQPSGTSKKAIFEGHDYLQTLVERDGNGASASILASMTDFLTLDNANTAFPQQDVYDMLLSPQIKIVSLTVTEGGYYLNDGGFDKAHPDIVHDAANPDTPKTIFGMIAKALLARKEAGEQPFTVMSCDNIPHNGEVVQSVVAGTARLMLGAEAANWIESNVAFPNSMVDRITPGTTDDTRQFVQDNYGFTDNSPVFCEPFRQWILEDKFSQGRPAWQNLPTVDFVDDVAPYELMKIRILNGGHASLCYPAALLELEYVHNAMEHPVLAPFLDALERNEIIPTVPPVPNTILTDYWKTIDERFSNPTICDTIERICYDGASRQPKFIVPVVRDALKLDNAKLDGVALVSAMWCRYCQGTTDATGKTIANNDPQWDRLQALALEAKTNPTAWLTGLPDVYGKDVGEDPTFSAAFAKALTNVQEQGVEEAMKAYTANAAS